MKTTQEFFNTLPKKVLLVGNGKLKNKSKIINSYNFVIRFNDFEIDGYETHVGTKVDAICFHAIDLTKEHTSYLIPQYNKYVDCVPIFCLIPSSNEYAGKMLYVEEDTRLNTSHVPIQLNPLKRLPTGVALALNLSLFYDIEVHLIGFDFWKSGHYYNSDFSEQHIDVGHLNLDSKKLSNIFKTIEFWNTTKINTK